MTSYMANAMNKLDTIWVINLARGEARKQAIIDQLKKLPTEITNKVKFFTAVDGQQIVENTYMHEGNEVKFNVISEWREPFNGKQLTKGEIGCALSHWLIWEEISKKQTGYASIILEDDIIFRDNFVEKLTNYLNYLGKDKYIDLMYLYRKAYKYDKEQLHCIAPKLRKVCYSHWTCGYLLTQQGADKLYKTDYINKIIPVDEFLPIVYNESHLKQYYKYYYNSDDIVNPIIYAVAMDPPIIDLAENAFLESATVASDPYTINTNKADDSYTTNTPIEVWGIGTHETSGRRRFKEFCNVYGLKYKIIGDGIVWKMDMAKGPGGGQKINILKTALLAAQDERPESMNNLVVVSDTYDVVALAPDTTIYKKYHELQIINGTSSNLIIFSAEKTCWPNTSLANEYPPSKVVNDKELPRFLNSGGFIGRKLDLLNILKDREVSDWDDDQLFWTQVYLGLLKTPISTLKIILDNESRIFQTLNNSFDDLTIKHTKGIISNNITEHNPCFLHGNGPPQVKLRLNWLENYLGNHWVKSYGYVETYLYKQLEENNLDKLPTIYVAVFGHNAYSDIFTQKIDYPAEKVTMEFYAPSFNQIYGRKVFNKFLQTKCDYFMIWEANHVEINDRKLLYKLLPKADKLGIVAPLVVRTNTAWSNYWGDVTAKGFYARSSDYFELIRKERLGIWNVPYVSQIYIIRRDILQNNPCPYDSTIYNPGDCDVAFCANIRKSGQFMYMDNLEDYGYIFKDYRPLAGANVSLFDYRTNRSEWERKYFDPQYLEKREKVEHTVICNDAYLLPMFTRAFCNEVIALVEKFGGWSAGTAKGAKYHDPRIGNIEEYPTDDIHLSQIGLEDLWKDLINDCFSRIASEKFSPYKTKGLNIAFVVRYTPEGQKELKPHHDASTYTLNIALNEHGVDYEGGGCRFLRQEVNNIGQIPGTVAIHPGRLTHYHQGLPTTKGVRYILVAFIN